MIMASEILLNIMKIDSEEVTVFKMNSAEVNVENKGKPSMQQSSIEMKLLIISRKFLILPIKMWAS